MGKYLDFYKKCMDEGRMPQDGLCDCFSEEEVEIFRPDRPHRTYGYDWYWAYNGRSYDWHNAPALRRDQYQRDFTPLRQNIVLLKACLANENFNDL